jgi:hypothetical protein
VSLGLIVACESFSSCFITDDDGEWDDNSDKSYKDEAPNTPSDKSDTSDSDSEAAEVASLSDEEVQGLEEDLKMPASAKKPASAEKSPKKVVPIDEITELASGLTISTARSSPWYNLTYQFPYVIYAFRDENNPVEHLVVEILAPTVPTEFIRVIEVMPCGTKLKVAIGTPRWFAEHTFIQRRLGGEYHAQHAAVDNFVTNVVQPIRSKFKENNPWIEGAPCIIPLPKKCQTGDINWQRGTWRTRNMDVVQGQIQFNWVISVVLKTTKVYELRNDEQAVENFAGLGDDDAL